MITQAIYDKKLLLAKAIEQAKTDNSRARITNLLNVVTLQSQLRYLITIQSANNEIE